MVKFQKKVNKSKIKDFVPKECPVCGSENLLVFLKKEGRCDDKQIEWENIILEFYCGNCGWLVEKIEI